MAISGASLCCEYLCALFLYHPDLALLWRPLHTLGAYTFLLRDEVVSWEEVVVGRVGVDLVSPVPCRRFQPTVRV